MICKFIALKKNFIKIILLQPAILNTKIFCSINERVIFIVCAKTKAIEK